MHIEPYRADIAELACYHQSTGEVEGADWSGRDHCGVLIFCREGKLFRRGANGQNDELADFNGLKPAPQPAPDWAREPLSTGESFSDRP